MAIIFSGYFLNFLRYTHVNTTGKHFFSNKLIFALKFFFNNN